MEDLITKIAIGISGFGAGAYGMYQKVKADSRNNRAADTTEAAWQQIVAALREEVERMSVRLAAVEEQNRKCEERNDDLANQIRELKATLHVT
jgi:hypothetical protein